MINLDKFKNTGTHKLHSKNEVIYFDGFGVEYISKEIKKFVGNKDIKTNMFRIRDYNSIMCGYFYILFILFCIEFMLKSKTLNDLVIYLVLMT